MAPKPAPGTPRHFFGALATLYCIAGGHAISQFQIGRLRFRLCGPKRKSAQSDKQRRALTFGDVGAGCFNRL